jgi:hypothetical protein
MELNGLMLCLARLKSVMISVGHFDYVNRQQNGVLVHAGFSDSEAVPEGTKPASAAAVWCIV